MFRRLDRGTETRVDKSQIAKIDVHHSICTSSSNEAESLQNYDTAPYPSPCSLSSPRGS